MGVRWVARAGLQAVAEWELSGLKETLELGFIEDSVETHRLMSVLLARLRPRLQGSNRARVHFFRRSDGVHRRQHALLPVKLN